jgi:hypothetical protein
VELLLSDGTFTFGEARRVGNVSFDPWLQSFTAKEGDLTQRQLTLVNELIITPFEKIDIIGGHRSKGGGRVEVKIDAA